MWQFHLLHLFTKSHGDLINLEGVGGGAWGTQRLAASCQHDCLQKSNSSPSATGFLDVGVWYLYKGVSYAAPDHSWGRRMLPARWLEQQQMCSVPAVPALPASHGSSGSSSPNSLQLLVLIMLLAGIMQRGMEATTGPPTRDGGLPCHHVRAWVHTPGDTNLWPWSEYIRQFVGLMLYLSWQRLSFCNWPIV